GKELDGDVAVEAFLLGEEDLAHAALAEPLEEGVAGDRRRQGAVLHEERRPLARGVGRRSLRRVVLRARVGLGGGGGGPLRSRRAERLRLRRGPPRFGLGGGPRRGGGRQDDFAALGAGDVLEELLGRDFEGMTAATLDGRFAIIHGAFLAVR